MSDLIPISNNFSASVILKGKETIICSYGDEELFICTEGGPELSSGGTGDVLAGVLSALIAQKVDIIDADHLCILQSSCYPQIAQQFTTFIWNDDPLQH